MAITRKTILLISAIALLGRSISAIAEPITYFWSTTGYGTLGSDSFTNSPITIAVYADTANVQTNSSGVLFVDGDAAAFVGNLGYAGYIGGRRIYSSDIAIDLQDIFTLFTSSYPLFDLKTNGFTRTLSGSKVICYGTSLPTSNGSVVIRNSGAVSFSAKLGYNGPPQIVTNVQSISVIEGASPTFVVSQIGAEPVLAQWRKDGEPIPGATGLSFTVTNALSEDSGEYDLVITNFYGQTQSAKGTLLVTASKPVITSNPLSQSVTLGSTVTLEATAVGSPPLSWRWFFNGSLLASETSNRLTRVILDNLSLGAYYAEVSNNLGSVATEPATLERSYIVAWGLSPGSLPLHNEDVISITGGDSHFVALRSNGRVDAWGGDYRGQGIVPDGLLDVVSIGAGSAHSVAVQKNGDVSMWGQFFSLIDTVSPRAKNEVAMVAMGVGAQHAVALKKEGYLVDWGGGDPNRIAFTPPESATNIVSVSAGAYHTLALRADGRVIAWGGPYADPASTNVPSSATGVVAIATGWFHNIALKADGTIIGWANGNLPFGDTNRYVDIACGASHSVGLARSGKIRCWGSSSYGLATPPANSTNAAGVGAGAYTAFALMAAGSPKFNTVAIDRHVEIGRNAYYRMWAIGTQPVRYLWRRNGSPIPDQTNSWLVVTNVQAADAGAIYTVIASNSEGETTSEPMLLNPSLLRIGGIQQFPDRLNIPADVPPGVTYKIETKTDLSDATWSSISETNATESSMNFSIPIPVALATRYYRIVRK